MLDITNLKCITPTLNNINLRINNHTVIIGPSGAGKTTLLRCIAGLQPYQGDISIDNKSINGLSGPRRCVSMAWQDGRLLPNFTVRQNIELGGDNSIDEWIDLFKIQLLLDKYPHELSGGEAQRVNILRAICSPAKIILLDEPMQGIDPIIVRKTLKQLLYKLNKIGKIVIMVTHELYQVYGLFEKAIFIKRGEVVDHGNFQHLYDEPTTPWMANFFGSYTVLSKNDLKNFPSHSNEDPCMVRPEWFEIKTNFSKDVLPNAVVTGTQWLGSYYKISLILEQSRKPLTVELYTDTKVNSGDKIYVNFTKCSRPNWVVDSAADGKQRAISRIKRD